MADKPKLRIKIKDFRAIHSADIILNGITVVAGINGSGKSTISKLLYRTVKTAIDFDKLVAENLFKELRDVRHFLDELSHEVEFFSRINLNRENRKKIAKEEFDLGFKFNRLFNFIGDMDLKEQEKKILESIDLSSKTFKELPEEFKKEERFKVRFYRLERFFKEEFFQKEKDPKKIDIPALLEKLKENIKKRFQKAYSDIENRPIYLLDKTIENYFTEDIDVNNYDIEELGALITNRADKKVSNFLTINKVAFIDTPMIVGVEDIGMTNVPHWEELDSLLKNKGENVNKKSKISKILKDEIIEGETKYDSKNDNFIYKRNDNFSLDLLSCATGLKSFSVLQMLFNNGFLDNKTLLILDEPEVHLHPEWIVQYARLVVLLHKEYKVNFLIGSHNPDMVMAIKYIAEKELGKNNNSVNFYVAKEFEKYSFDYENSYNSIEPIFSSFNTSLDKINEYGPSKD
jgi:predicted ATPase